MENDRNRNAYFVQKFHNEINHLKVPLESYFIVLVLDASFSYVKKETILRHLPGFVEKRPIIIIYLMIYSPSWPNGVVKLWHQQSH